MIYVVKMAKRWYPIPTLNGVRRIKRTRKAIAKVGNADTTRELLYYYDELAGSPNIATLSSIASAGLELQLIECYMKGVTLQEVTQLIKTGRKVNASIPLIKRYWSLLRRLGVRRNMEK